MNIPIKWLEPNAALPKRANDIDAGYDLFATHAIQIVSQGGRALVKIGISIAIPPGYYGRIAPRSGLALKKGIDVLAGVVDASYRGELGVVLINHGLEPFDIVPGDRIAQLIIEKCHTVEWQEVDTLPDSQRGADGFGSSGT